MTLIRNSGRNRKDTKSGHDLGRRDSVRFDLSHLVRIKANLSTSGHFMTFKTHRNCLAFWGQSVSDSGKILLKTQIFSTQIMFTLYPFLILANAILANLWRGGQLVTLRPTCHIEDRSACHVEGQLVTLRRSCHDSGLLVMVDVNLISYSSGKLFKYCQCSKHIWFTHSNNLGSNDGKSRRISMTYFRLSVSW